MSSRSNPGRLYNRRVTKHIEELLPERVLSDRDFTFDGETIIDRQNNPGKPAGGTCKIKAYVGSDGQLAVLEKSQLTSRGKTLWACWNRIRRTHAVKGSDLPPFRYHVQTQIFNQGERKRDETVVSFVGLEEMPVYGGREAQAALILAESLAVEKAVAPEKRNDICCSLYRLPSLPRVINSKNMLRLDWKEVDALIGPDAEMIAANVNVKKVLDEERQEAIEKGVTMFTDDGPELDERERSRSRCEKGAEQPDQHEKDERISSSLPDGMTPEEAEEKILEMAEEIYEMRTRSTDSEE